MKVDSSPDSYIGSVAGGPQKTAEKPVAGADLAAAVRIALTVPQGPAGALFLNVSDLALDRADLLALWSEVSGIAGRVPGPADASSLTPMATDRLRALGWCTGGRHRLRAELEFLRG